MIGLAAAGAMFNNRLSISVAQYAPNLPPSTAAMVKESILVIGTLQTQDKQNVIKAYSSALGTSSRPRNHSPAVVGPMVLTANSITQVVCSHWGYL